MRFEESIARAQAPVKLGVRVKCPLGGYAPCIDDLCHGGGQTLCGLYMDEEVCFHGYIPETCLDCSEEDPYDDWPEDF